MASYMVITKLTDKDGTHEVGKIIEVTPNSAEEKVALDKLISYGILAEAPEVETKPSKSTRAK